MLRVFRLVSAVRRLRRIVVALLHAVPGSGSLNSTVFVGVLSVSVIKKNIWTKFPGMVRWRGLFNFYTFTNYDIRKLVHGNRLTCNGNLSVGLDFICCF